MNRRLQVLAALTIATASAASASAQGFNPTPAPTGGWDASFTPAGGPSWNYCWPGQVNTIDGQNGYAGPQTLLGVPASGLTIYADNYDWNCSGMVISWSWSPSFTLPGGATLQTAPLGQLGNSNPGNYCVMLKMSASGIYGFFDNAGGAIVNNMANGDWQNLINATHGSGSAAWNYYYFGTFNAIGISGTKTALPSWVTAFSTALVEDWAFNTSFPALRQFCQAQGCTITNGSGGSGSSSGGTGGTAPTPTGGSIGAATFDGITMPTFPGLSLGDTSAQTFTMNLGLLPNACSSGTNGNVQIQVDTGGGIVVAGQTIDTSAWWPTGLQATVRLFLLTMGSVYFLFKMWGLFMAFVE